jgi:hypothetical protein
MVHSEIWPEQPRFNNPDDVYALFDLLRTRNCADQWFKRLETAPTTLSGSSDSEAEGIVRTLNRADGSPVRRERWEFQSGRLVCLHIQQWPLGLQHRAPHEFELRQSVQGVDEGSIQTVQPQSVLVFPALTYRIDFRSVDPARDSLEEPSMRSASATVPARVRITADGRTVALCEFKGSAAGVGQAGAARVQRALHAWSAAGAERAAMRAQDMMLAEGACASGDVAQIHLALANAARRNVEDGVPGVMAATNAEVCVRRLEEAGHHGAAAVVVTNDWLPAVMAQPVADRVVLAAHALESGCAALGRAVAGPLADATPEVEELLEWGEFWRMRPPLIAMPLSSCALDCQTSLLPQPSKAFLEAIGGVLGAEPQRADGALSSPLANAFERCAAWAVLEAANQGIVPGPIQIERASQDLRAALRSGRGELSAEWLAHPANWCVACHRFSRRVVRALRVPTPPDQERHHLREAMFTFARAGSGVVRDLAEELQLSAAHAKEAATLVLEALQTDAELAGNAFEPRFLRWPVPTGQAVDSAAPNQQLPSHADASDAIRAAVKGQAGIRALLAEQEVRQQSRVSFGRRMPTDANEAAIAQSEPPPDPERRRTGQLADAATGAARNAFGAWYAARSRK